MNLSTALALTAPATAAVARPLARWANAWLANTGSASAQHRSAGKPCLAGPIAHSLAQGETLVVDNALGQLVICQSGCAWITYDRDPKDTIVEAGGRHQGSSNSRMLVHAVSDVQLTITPVGTP